MYVAGHSSLIIISLEQDSLADFEFYCPRFNYADNVVDNGGIVWYQIDFCLLL